VKIRDNNWLVHSALPEWPMDVFVEITRNGCKCLESTSRPHHPPPPRHQRVSHYLATAVTTAQRLMHAIVAASRPELPSDHRQTHSYRCGRTHLCFDDNHDRHI